MAGPLEKSSSGSSAMFEMYLCDVDDDPVAPPAMDFPPGCCARVDHPDQVRHVMGDLWQSRMAALCPDTEVHVLRHSGDFTVVRADFPISVLCDDAADGTVKWTLTIHRACLKDMRVVTPSLTNYPSSTRGDSLTAMPPLGDSDSNLSSHALRAERGEGNRLFSRGHVLRAAEVYTQAIAAAESSHLAKSAEHMRLLTCRSAALHRMRKYADALEDAKRAIAFDPTYFQAYLRAGHSLRAQRLFDDADSYYRIASEMAPEDAALRAQREANQVDAMMSRVGVPTSAELVLDTNKVKVISRRRVAAGDRVFAEVPYASVAASSRGVVMCSNCQQPQMSQDEATHALRAVVQPSAMAQAEALLPSTLPAFAAVECKHACGAVYCSERCRSVAWSTYHWIECPSGGTWAAGTRRILGPECDPSIALTIRAAARFLACRDVRHDAQNLRRYTFSRVTPTIAAWNAADRADVDRYYGALRAGFDDMSAEVITQDAFAELVRNVRTTRCRFRCSPLYRLQEVISMHMGFAAESSPDSERLAQLRDVHNSIETAGHDNSHEAWGVFHVLGCCRHFGESWQARGAATPTDAAANSHDMIVPDDASNTSSSSPAKRPNCRVANGVASVLAGVSVCVISGSKPLSTGSTIVIDTDTTPTLSPEAVSRETSSPALRAAAGGSNSQQ